MILVRDSNVTSTVRHDYEKITTAVVSASAPQATRVVQHRHWGMAHWWAVAVVPFLLVRQGEFGPQTHPLEPWSLKLHGAFAFAVIWVFGLLWGVHVTTAWPLGRRRWSGGVMTGVLWWLTVSGYLLYYVSDETARSLISLLHWTVGLAGPLVFFWHRYRRRRGGRRRSLDPKRPVVQSVESDAAPACKPGHR